MLGGEHIAFDRSVVAHSDGDVLLHAVCDALLGAAGLGDLGAWFPDSDPRYASASSRTLLREVRERVAEAGWRAVNVDATVIAEAPAPRGSPRRDARQSRGRSRSAGGGGQRQGDHHRGNGLRRSWRGDRLPRGGSARTDSGILTRIGRRPLHSDPSRAVRVVHRSRPFRRPGSDEEGASRLRRSMCEEGAVGKGQP